MSEDLVKLQERITHLERVNDELSDICTDLNTRLAKAEKRIDLLLDYVRQSDGGGGAVVMGDPPPHY